MIKAPNGDILIDKKVTGIENLLDLIVDTTGLQKGDIRIDESTIRDVSEKDRNTAVDVEITKGGHTNRVVAYYNRVSLTEIGTVDSETKNDWVLNYIDGQNGDFSMAFNDKNINTKLKKEVADRVNIPSDEIVVESIDYSNKHEGNTSVTFKAVGDNAKTIKDKFTVKSWYIPPIYTINDENFDKKLGTPSGFSDEVRIIVKNDRDIVVDSSTHVADGHRHADNPLFFPKGHITDFDSTNYEFGNTDDELIGYMVDAHHTGEIQDSVNNKYEITEIKQLENGFCKVWVENKNKDITDNNGYYKIKQLSPTHDIQTIKFIDGTSSSVEYIHGKIQLLVEGEGKFIADDGREFGIKSIPDKGWIILPSISDIEPPPFINDENLTEEQQKAVNDFYEKVRNSSPDFMSQEMNFDARNGMFNLDYGQIFKVERIDEETKSHYSDGDAIGTAKIIKETGSGGVFDGGSKTYYSHSNYGRLYRSNDWRIAIYFAKMTAGATPSAEEIKEEKELIKRELFNRYGFPYDKISIDWDSTEKSNFTELYFDVSDSSLSIFAFGKQLVHIYKRVVPKFGINPAIKSDIRFLLKQRFKDGSNDKPSWFNDPAYPDKDRDGIDDYYYYSES